MSDQYEIIVGMEIHVELKTKSKMFCGCKNDPFHAPNPNIYTCPVCLGLPGALPVPNRKAVEWAMMLGLALNCRINEVSRFDRKHYFYPDLPKGYQISQYDQPLANGGWLELTNNPIAQSSSNPIKKRIRIRRVHLEEDTGKLYHQKVDEKPVTLIDFNRSGVPLVEIVTEPDIRNGEEATVFLKKLHQIIRYLDISDADMEKGSMRLEPNISVRKSQIQNLNDKPSSNTLRDSSTSLHFVRNDMSLPNYKVEVKNINSFKFVRKAIEYEVNRQIALLEKGETPRQETRGWDEDKGVTYAQRYKEEAEDYRYFPEPDIPPMRFAASQISELRTRIPKMPDEVYDEFIDFGLTPTYASLASVSPRAADFFKDAFIIAEKRDKSLTKRVVVNWIMNRKIDLSSSDPNKIIDDLIRTRTVEDVPEETINRVIESVLNANVKAVGDYKAGKEQSFMFLFGQVLRQLQGKGDKKKIQEILREKLKK